MLNMTQQTLVYFARDPLDMRKQIDGIGLAVQEVLLLDPFSTHLFAFCNKQRDKIKVICWQNNGFSLLYKRLEKGRFAWPRRDEDVVTLTLRELYWLLEGHSLTSLPTINKLPTTTI